MLRLPENGNGACCIKTDRYQSDSLVKKILHKKCIPPIRNQVKWPKMCFVFYLYKNKLFNKCHAIKTISSSREKYKLKHEAELFSKSRNYSGCFQPLGQMSYYLGSCIPKSFLSTTYMHALGLLKCIRNIPNCPFLAMISLLGLSLILTFQTKYLFTNIDMMSNLSKYVEGH